MSVCCESCVLSRVGLLGRADHSPRGVLLNVVRRCVRSKNPLNEGGPDPLGGGLLHQKIQNKLSWTCHSVNLDDLLTVHRCITLVDFQLDARNSYLFIYNTFIKILYVFRALPCSSSGGLRRNCI
jgi:hypothetical protein